MKIFKHRPVLVESDRKAFTALCKLTDPEQFRIVMSDWIWAEWLPIAMENEKLRANVKELQKEIEDGYLERKD